MRGYKYLFGPVRSRRFGMSLGVDLVNAKTCSMDCVFCQLGRTGRHTTARKAHVPADRVIRELADWYRKGGKADYVTLSGSGEPTLNTGFGKVIRYAASRGRIPVLLLTNGSTLWLPAVRKAAAAADAVKISLCAWDGASFRRINRPARGLSFKRFVGGEKTFAREYGGRLIVEVFVVPGMNSSPAQMRKIAAIAASLQPDEIHLNTAVRPAAQLGVRALSARRMRELARLFTPRAKVAEEGEGRAASSAAGVDKSAVLALVGRHPCTPGQIAATLGMSTGQARKILDMLESGGSVARAEGARGDFYRAAREKS